MKFRKLLSFVLAVMCILSTFSLSANACDHEDEDGAEYTCCLADKKLGVYRYNPTEQECPVCRGYLTETTGVVYNTKAATKCPENTSKAHVPFEYGTYMFCNSCKILSYWITKEGYGTLCMANVTGHSYSRPY